MRLRLGSLGAALSAASLPVYLYGESSSSSVPPVISSSPRTFRVHANLRVLRSYEDVATVLREAMLKASPDLSTKNAQERVITIEGDDYGFSHFSYHRGVAPVAVAFPSNTAEVSALMRTCAENRLNVIARGGGTSLEGQVLPLGGLQQSQTFVSENLHYARPTVVFDMQRMCGILEVNPQDLDIRVQAGVGWGTLVTALKPFGLMFPVDPGPGARMSHSSRAARAHTKPLVYPPSLLSPTTHAHAYTHTHTRATSTEIGGMCGTGCSGTHAVKHGSMKANVLSLTAVASDGSVLKTGGRSRKSVSGLDLTSLLIGSEGTLGIVTEAVLKVVPIPAATIVISTPFPTVRAAAAAVSRAAALGVPLAAAELLDAPMVACIRGLNSELLPAGPTPHVLWKLSGGDAACREAAETLRGICKEAGGMAWSESNSEEGAAELWEARKSALLSVQITHSPLSVLTTDVCVPVSKLPRLMEDFEEHYARESEKRGAGALPPVYAVAHAGDGNCHHFFAFAPGSPQEEDAKLFADWLALKAISLEGTCTGEHGVGVGKLKFLPKELGETNARFARAIKCALDPSALLNPGKKIPPAGAQGH